MSKITDEAVKLKKNIDAVYEAGQRSMIDCAKVTRTTKQGSFVVIDDIADVKQDITVQLTSDTTTDFSGVQLKVYKDNLFTDDFINGTFDPATGALMSATNRIRSMNYIEVGAGTYTLYTPNTNHSFVVYMYDTNGNYLEAGSIKSWSNSNKMEFTVDRFCKILFALCVPTGAPISPNDVDWVLLTRSENAEPQVFTPNENGVVEGIDYSSTGVIFTTDNDDVTINVTYYKSYWQLDESEYKAGYSVGFEDGKTAEWSELWDGLQDYGNRTTYAYFCVGNPFIIDKDTKPRLNFKPKYDLKPVNAQSMFQSFNTNSTAGLGYESIVTDLTQWLEDLGVTLDTSNCTNAQNMFYNCHGFSRIPFLDFSNCTGANSLANFIAQTWTIQTIDGIKSSENTAWDSRSFGSANNVSHCIFSGVIAKSFSLSNTKLDKESLLSVLNTLKDLTGTGTTLTLTLGTTLLAKLTDAEKAIATQKGWTLA